MQKTEVKIKLLDWNSVMPTYAKEGDAGMDMTVTKVIKKSLFRIEYGFGIAMQPPQGTFVDLRPRSSIWKTRMLLSNSCGTGDAGYTGEYKAVFWKLPFISNPYKVGERALQMVLKKFEQVQFVEVSKLEQTERGSNGYGHTGK